METEADQLLAQFRCLDLNGDGAIDRGELLSVLQGSDPDGWSDERVGSVLEAADMNGDSLIQYEEFVAWARKGGKDWGDLDRVAATVSPPAIAELTRTLSAMSQASGKHDLVAPLQQLQDVEWERKEPALSLLLKLLQNIARNPADAKYRTLKKTNKTLQEKVFSVPGCLAVLLAAGFEEEGELLLLPEGVEVQWVLDEVANFGNEERMSQLRAERDARIARLRAEEHKNKELRGAHLSGDAEEKRKILEKLEYDRQERLAREKLAKEGYREEAAIPAEKAGGAVTRFSDIGVDINRGGG